MSQNSKAQSAFLKKLDKLWKAADTKAFKCEKEMRETQNSRIEEQKRIEASAYRWTCEELKKLYRSVK